MSLTDNEITKALECCIQHNCIECPRCYETSDDADICKTQLMRNTLDLINRQKAEIENYIKVAEYQQSLTMKKSFEIKELNAKLNATIAGQETLQKALKEKNAEIENLKEKIIEDDKLLSDRVVESVNAVSKAHPRIAERLKELGTIASGKAVIALENFKSALKDQNRMCEAQNEIIALSSNEFVTAFNHVAKLICNARVDAFADTYCFLAKTAVEMLVKGEDEKDVLYYFDKIYVKEMVGDANIATTTEKVGEG